MPPHQCKWKNYPMRFLLVALVTAVLGACGFIGFPGVYKIDVEQGNIVTQEMAAQLKTGMSRRQVRFILGTPLVEDAFNQNRWDYTYAKRNGQDLLEESQLTVFFEDDSLREVVQHALPSEKDEEAAKPEKRKAR